MAIRTFNVDDAVYLKFSRICKEQGLSMSRQIDMFIKSFVEEEPKARAEYLEKLRKIRSGKFIKVENFGKRYGLK
jgi:antitoxin component of RelBE/YafQ-DinJ toxin-antitoxin module